MEPRSGLPSFWSTHIAKVLVGDQPCLLQPWLMGRFDFPKETNPSMANWKANHTQQLQAVVERYKADGWKCDVERFFRVKGQTAILSGKVDIIARKDGERPLIIDAKSGQARDSDVAQVLLEMICIPLAWEAPEMTFSGLVVYQGAEVKVQASEATVMRPKLFGLLKQLGTMPRPEPTPGRDACRFCEVPDSECGVRFKNQDAVTTELF